MWIYLVVVALLGFGIVGGIAGGGIFTIVLLPIAAIVLVAGVAYRGMGHAAGGGNPVAADPPPLPTSSPNDPARVTATPDDLVDARRAQQ